jgi:adenylate cyclase
VAQNIENNTHAYAWASAPSVSMREIFNKTISKLFGDYRRHTLEHRLFNTVTLLSGVANVGGSFMPLVFGGNKFLFFWQLGIGIVFLLFYYLSRQRNMFQDLYWPFVLLILVFLFVNSIFTAGTRGSAHYYFIPALVIAVILSNEARKTAIVIVLFGLAVLILLLLEQYRPEILKSYSSSNERFFDVAGNVLFVQVFTALLVMVLSQNLNQERKKSDRLLHSILPDSVADELKANDRVQPVDYECASVLFTDFVGFTQQAERFTPQQLIEELDHCFTRFDEIVEKHNLEKIKTIGDAYMAAGGLPKANKTHAVDCILAALEIERFMSVMMKERAAINRPFWQLRIGIHSGDLIAGVIGREKFAYDVWGDTVNTANRLESSGEPGRINISRATCQRVKDFFKCEYRGRVSAKGKGEIEMYFVNGIHAELSDDGITPNEKFLEMYQALI